MTLKAGMESTCPGGGVDTANVTSIFTRPIDPSTFFKPGTQARPISRLHAIPSCKLPGFKFPFNDTESSRSTQLQWPQQDWWKVALQAGIRKIPV